MILIGIDILTGNRMSQKLMGKIQFNLSPASHFMFGVVFAISWTPCVGAYLSSALALTMTASHLWQSVLMIVIYCLGLGLPLMVTALLVDEVEGLLNRMKGKAVVTQKIAGLVLIFFGVLWMTGYLSSWISV